MRISEWNPAEVHSLQGVETCRRDAATTVAPPAGACRSDDVRLRIARRVGVEVALLVGTVLLWNAWTEGKLV